ncbi:Protein transport protein [Mycena chlorophos]|uniref:Protein transport protein n=2 Tax=Mycena chlorophos TaxID=658473 RepID=A0ABQ0KZ72_MYCCL|nr:Protein transport protein [Mycena chlorophos]GAT44213.1 protein transport protein [Mycena chlorophos]
MSFLKKKSNNQSMIPPVQDGNSTSPRPMRGGPGSANTYVPSRDGDAYGSRSNSYGSERSNSYSSDRTKVDYNDRKTDPSDNYRDKYNRNNGVGDVYSRGGAKLDEDRAALFSGYNPEKRTGGSGRFFDGPDLGREPEPGEENEEDVEGIKKQTRFIKQESASSTRNALRLAREAEETARNTLTRLGSQSERLANTERHLDVSKGHSQRADDKTDELNQLNRSIFRPVIVFNKDAKRAAQEAKVTARYEEERTSREQAAMETRESYNRIGRAQTYGRDGDDGRGELMGGSGRFRSDAQNAARKEQRKRYQFEATASDDELEDEIDDNLDEIGDAAKRLKALGLAMGQELDTQIQRIDRLDQKTVNLDNRINRNTERLKKVK